MGKRRNHLPFVVGVASACGLLLACLSTTGHAGDWTKTNKVAWTAALETSDGDGARLEVRCRPEPEVRLLHPSLDELTADTSDRRPGWYGVVRVTGGWGLDLRRPDHHGAITYWWRCEDMRGCLRASDAEWIIRNLKKNWSVHLLSEPKDGPAVDMRFSLAGSRNAIEATCGEESSTKLKRYD
ncbi:MAG: hypothetical protein OXU81_13690 [Gammaproteobacteria bacterium]|nr:hypothetical protein [Gammaproteobacteria bacterium]